MLGTGPSPVTVIIRARYVGDRIADEQIRRHSVRGLDARPGKDVDPAVTGDRFKDDIQIISKFRKIAETSR